MAGAAFGVLKGQAGGLVSGCVRSFLSRYLDSTRYLNIPSREFGTDRFGHEGGIVPAFVRAAAGQIQESVGGTESQCPFQGVWQDYDVRGPGQGPLPQGT